MALVSRDDTGNLADVLHSIIEQNKVHLGVHFVVVTESVSEFGGQIVDLGELVVELFIEALDEVGEDKRLGVFLLEELAQVEFGEGLLDLFGAEKTVLDKVLDGDETITVDALGLVDPQFDQLVGLLDGFLFGNKEALENIGQVTHVEFIMEVDGGLTERRHDISVHCQRALDDLWNQL